MYFVKNLCKTTIIGFYFFFSFSKRAEMVFCFQNCSKLLWEIFLKIEGECREFAKCLRSLEQFTQTVKVLKK